MLDHLSKSIGGPVLGMMSPGAGTGSQAGVEGPQLNSKLNIVTPQTHTQAVTQITVHTTCPSYIISPSGTDPQRSGMSSPSVRAV